jgi:hypothetical protein
MEGAEVYNKVATMEGSSIGSAAADSEAAGKADEDFEVGLAYKSF